MNCRISLMSALSSAVSDLSRDSEKSRPRDRSYRRFQGSFISCANDCREGI